MTHDPRPMDDSDDAATMHYLRARDYHGAWVDVHVAPMLGWDVDRARRSVERLARLGLLTVRSRDYVRLTVAQLRAAGGALRT